LVCLCQPVPVFGRRLIRRPVKVWLFSLSWVGVGWGCVNVLDMTSYILDVTLKVLGWGGAVLTLLIGRLAYRNLYKQIHVQKSVGQTLLSNDSCWHVELDSTWRHLKKCRPQSFQQKLNSKVNPMRYLNHFKTI
jgi:hypothetical protein